MMGHGKQWRGQGRGGEGLHYNTFHSPRIDSTCMRIRAGWELLKPAILITSQACHLSCFNWLIPATGFSICIGFRTINGKV